MKKFIALFSGIALAVSSLLAAGPATAVSDQTHDFGLMTRFAHQQVLADNSVFVWGVETGDNTQSVVGYLISPEGQVGEPKIFDIFPVTDYTDSWAWSFLQTKAGKLIFTWSSYSSNTRVSSLKVSTSLDGITWTNPVSPVANFIPPVGKCEFFDNYSARCGYMALKLGEDGKGRIGLGFNTHAQEAGSTASSISLVTTTNFTSWTKPAVYRPAMAGGGSSYVDSLIGLAKGGFLMTWGSWGESAESIGSGFWSFGATKLSSVSKSDSSADVAPLADVIKLSDTRYLQLYTIGPSDLRIGYRILDLNTKRWTAPRVLGSYAGSWPDYIVVSKPNLFGDIYLTFRANGWDVGGSQPAGNKLALIKIPAGGLPQNPISVASISGGEHPVALTFGADSKPIMYLQADNSNYLSTARIVDDLLQPAQVLNSTTGWFHSVTFDLNGNPSYLYSTDDDSVHFKRFRRDALPVAQKIPAVTGKAKVKSTLTASAVEFKANNAAGDNTYQWYTCTSKQTEVRFNFVSFDCSAIPGETARTYRVSSSDVGQYLAVTVSSTNTSGTTQILTKSTSKVTK